MPRHASGNVSPFRQPRPEPMTSVVLSCGCVRQFPSAQRPERDALILCVDCGPVTVTRAG